MAFPTETVYGLGANALDAAAVARIFAAKERARDDPLIVHLAGAEALARVALAIPPLAQALAAAHWPGPLTLVLPKSEAVPASVTAGLDSVAVRVPALPVARALIEAAGVPLAAPSANRFTRTSATTAEHVLADLGGRIELVLDGGPATAGIESTVVQVEDGVVRMLRPGALTLEALQETLAAAGYGGEVLFGGRAKASPGMMAKHYAPRARLVYVRGPGALAAAAGRLRAERAASRRAGLIASDEQLAALGEGGGLCLSLGPGDALDVAARRLFAALRELDARGAEVVVALAPSGAEGLGRAIDDRLRRAAAEVVES